MERLAQDLKHALRMFREQPVFTATVVAAMTLGIGVNTAIFSVVNAVLLDPLPFRDPGTLVAIENTSSGTPYGPWSSPAKLAYWRQQTDVFGDIAAVGQFPRRLNLTGGDRPEQVAASQTSEAYFRVLGAPFARGRAFTADEDQPGGPSVAVISYDLWQSRFGGADDALGTRLSLGGEAYTIVGITGRDFDVSDFGGRPDLWVPFRLDPNSTDEANFFVNLARLKPGVTLAEAEARVAASSAGFRQLYPAMPATEGFTVRNARETYTTMYGDPRARLWVLFGAVGFVLLIACANVANLFLVRASGRAREIAIRSALGAGRARILRQLLTESLVLSLVGGALGLVVGFFGIRALLAVNTAGLPRLGPGGSLVDLDWRVLTFTLGLSLATGLVFGLFPALTESRTDLTAVMNNAAGRSGTGLRQNMTRSVLVTVEVGLAVVLLIGAALLIRTSLELGRVDPGFDPSQVVTMSMTPSATRFPTARSLSPTIRAGLERLRSMPGVDSAAVTCCPPLQGAVSLPFEIDASADGEPTGSASYVPSSEGYFAAFEIPVLRGRVFTERDNAGTPAVAVINEAMAERFWADGRDPLQASIQIGAAIPELRGGPVRRIVGIVGDVRHGGLGRPAQPLMYVPLSQVADPVYALLTNGGAPLVWVARTHGDSVAPGTAIGDAIREVTGLPVADAVPMDRVVADSVSNQRLNMLLMSVFGGAASLLAALGIYGQMAFSVQQRVREIGIRMALGADARRVRRMVVRQGLLLVAIGIAAGLLVAVNAADVLASFLFEVQPRDPAVFTAVPAVLGLIALLALWAPAGRASRVDPMNALRSE